MQFDAGVLYPGLALACTILAGVLLLAALPGLGALRGHPERLHLLAGAAVALASLWSVNAGVDPGISLHVLGIPAVVLLLGWRLGMLAAALAAVALLLLGETSLDSAPVGWLVSAALPGAVITAVAWAARFYLPRNPFVFIFVGAFFGAGLAIAATWLAGAALLAMSGQPSPSGSGSSLIAFLPLVLFPEAFINGAVTSMLVVYRPGWVRLYDERFYDRPR
jgi:uncharacterized membrane protein